MSTAPRSTPMGTPASLAEAARRTGLADSAETMASAAVAAESFSAAAPGYVDLALFEGPTVALSFGMLEVLESGLL